MEKRQKSITVTQLNRFVSQLLVSQAPLQKLLVQGELSNVKRYASGHWYFNLKDQNAQVSCVMFRTAADRLRLKPEDGLEVLLHCSAKLYERDGKFQLYVDNIESIGQGDLFLAYEQLKQNLEKEGLFDSKHKKPIPTFPKTIGVVTSQSGAVIRDIIHVAKRRYPSTKIVLAPVKVQGEGSAISIARAIQYFNSRNDIDVLIVGRGGGSIEDLWSFNDEHLARVIFASKIPIISAVGHETDFTICDFVADLRAPTPSAAAELAVPNSEVLLRNIEEYNQALARILLQKLQMVKMHFTRLAENRYLQNPYESLNDRRQALDMSYEKMVREFQARFQSLQQKFQKQVLALDHLSPLKVLSRGYAMVTEENSKTPIVSIESIDKNDSLTLYMRDGSVHCKVLGKEEKSYEE